MIEAAKRSGRAVSVGLLGNAAEIFREIADRGVVPDVVTDQTSAHDPINGYLPSGWSVEEWIERRERDPKGTAAAAKRSMAEQVRAILALRAKGAVAVDYGNNIRAMAHEMGVADAFTYPGFVEAYVRPLFCVGKGPFRWVALSGDPDDIYRTDDKVRELIPDDPSLHIPGSTRLAPIYASRVCHRASAGSASASAIASVLRSTRWSRRGEVAAPIVIGRDHMDSGSVASPMRETEGMLDGSDAVSDWPILNALLNSACGATWVSFHHGGGVGIGYSQHAGMALVADGTPAAAEKIARVLWNDPATGNHAARGCGLRPRAGVRATPWRLAPDDRRLIRRKPG